jgi:hypothetical protein
LTAFAATADRAGQLVCESAGFVWFVLTPSPDALVATSESGFIEYGHGKAALAAVLQPNARQFVRSQ